MNKEKITVLRWFDIVILTIILIGQGIVNSTLLYLDMLKNPVVPYTGNGVEFSSLQNYQALANQLVWLFLACLYLLFRNFDFSVWFKKIRLTAWLPLQTIGIFLLIALAMDIFHLLTYQFANPAIPSLPGIFSKLDLSLILYSLLNGFYEEIFFLGICLTVKPEYQKWAFLYSLIIRFSFHTYQGLGAAFGIGILMGFIFYFLYKKMGQKNLLPFFLAHAIADMIGLSIIFYFWQ